MNNSLLIILILICGCSYTPLSKSETEVLKSLKSKSIIDLTNAVDFNKYDSLVITDSLFLTRISKLLNDSSKNSKIIYLAQHEDRLVLTNLQYRAECVLSHFVNNGVNKEKIKAKVGLDFKLKYHELKSSSIVLSIN